MYFLTAYSVYNYDDVEQGKFLTFKEAYQYAKHLMKTERYNENDIYIKKVRLMCKNKNSGYIKEKPLVEKISFKL
jgi:hypothetical protein